MTEQFERVRQVAGVETQLGECEEVGGDEAVVLSLVFEDELLQGANGGEVGLVRRRRRHQAVDGGAKGVVFWHGVRVRAPGVNESLQAIGANREDDSIHVHATLAVVAGERRVVHRLGFCYLILGKVKLDELALVCGQAVGVRVARRILAGEFDLAKQDGLARFLGKPWFAADVVEDLVRVGG